jgi:hypothetical protein
LVQGQELLLVQQEQGWVFLQMVALVSVEDYILAHGDLYFVEQQLLVQVASEQFHLDDQMLFLFAPLGQELVLLLVQELDHRDAEECS